MATKYHRKNPSSSLSRQIATYPHPKYYALAVGYAGMQNVAKAEVAEEAIKKMFDAMPIDVQSNILKFYSQMTSEEKKYPHKIINHW